MAVALLTKMVPVSPLDAFLASIHVLKEGMGEEAARTVLLCTLIETLGCGDPTAEPDDVADTVRRLLSKGMTAPTVH